MEYSLSEKLKRYSVYMNHEWQPNRVNISETLKSYSEEAENLEKRIEELEGELEAYKINNDDLESQINDLTMKLDDAGLL